LAATALITLLQVIVFVLVAVPRAELPALTDEVRVWIAANKGILTFVVAVTVIVYFVVLFAAADGFSRWFGKRLAATGKI
jgi:hypothetical protein